MSWRDRRRSKLELPPPPEPEPSKIDFDALSKFCEILKLRCKIEEKEIVIPDPESKPNVCCHFTNVDPMNVVSEYC